MFSISVQIGNNAPAQILPTPLGCLYFLGQSTQQFTGGRQSAAPGDTESPPDFSFWAAAIAFILTSLYLYTDRYFGLAGSIIAGLIAAYLTGSVFNMLMRMIVFLIKLAIYIAIVLVAGYYFMKIFQGAVHF